MNLPIYQVRLERTGALIRDGRKTCETPALAVSLFREFIGDSPREVFALIALNARSGVIGVNKISEGTLSASLVHPREVFQPAILMNAAAVVVCHNHPSGDPTPSFEDKDATRRLKSAGDLLGIPLLDHIVLGEEGGALPYFSFKDRGLL